MLDLEQSGIFNEDAVKLDAYTAAIAVRVANAASGRNGCLTASFATRREECARRAL